MSKPSHNRPNNRTIQLIEALLDGTIESSGFEELTKVLADDAGAVSAYVEYVNLHSALRQNFLSHSSVATENLELQLGDGLNQSQATRKARSSTKWVISFIAAIAAVLLIGSALLFLTDDISSDEEPRLAESSGPVLPSAKSKQEDIESVAVMTRLVDVVWDDESASVSLGTPLPRQQLKIKSGLMQIEFYCGAAVILEGPATFELIAPDRGFAHAGKLRALVPARARGFSIGTKSGNVVDLGTEFGLNISEDGNSELHVIDGEVDFHDSRSTKATPRRLVGGQGIQVSSNGNPHRLIQSDSSRFVNYAELNARARIMSKGRLQRWQKFHARLQGDPSLVANYVFDDHVDWGRTLVNAAPGANETSFGAIVGASWRQGRWPGSKALSFRSPSDRVRIKIDGEYESLTLATWVNLEQLRGARAIALLHPEVDYSRNDPNNKQRFIHWTLNPTDLGAIQHFSESHGHSTVERNHYSSKGYGIRKVDLGSWIHLALVYDRDALRVSHYKDGELVGSMPIESPRTMSIGIADIGNWPYKGWAAGTQFEFRNLTALMDEFIVLGRALSSEEVSEMYAVGKP